MCGTYCYRKHLIDISNLSAGTSKVKVTYIPAREDSFNNKLVTTRFSLVQKQIHMG